jgi:hypothetical protein
MKDIALTRGKVTTVDDEDYEYLSKFKWHAQPSRETFYAVRTQRIGSKRVQIRMHRVILGISESSLFADHRDRNGLNNQKNNLRLATILENNRNKSGQKNSKSKFKGVSWYPRNKKWGVRIRIKEIGQIFIGLYKDESEAAKEYDIVATKYFGEFAKLNFPIPEFTIIEP